MTATILKQGSNQAIRFFVMESLKDWYREGDPKKAVPKWIVGMFGGFAGACSVMGNTPLDVIKTRMQGLEAAKYTKSFLQRDHPKNVEGLLGRGHHFHDL